MRRLEGAFSGRFRQKFCDAIFKGVSSKRRIKNFAKYPESPIAIGTGRILQRFFIVHQSFIKRGINGPLFSLFST
jgi:hypothetical protein